MAVDETSYTPLEIIAGSAEVRSIKVMIPAGHAAIPALTPLKYDANFRAIPATALGDTVIGALIPMNGSQQGALIGTTVDAAEQPAHVYTDAELFGDLIDFTAMPTADNDRKKASIFASTGINLVFPAAGQV